MAKASPRAEDVTAAEFDADMSAETEEAASEEAAPADTPQAAGGYVTAAAQSKKKQRQFPHEKRIEVQGEFRSEIAGGQVRPKKRSEEHGKIANGESKGAGKCCAGRTNKDNERELMRGEDAAQRRLKRRSYGMKG